MNDSLNNKELVEVAHGFAKAMISSDQVAVIQKQNIG